MGACESCAVCLEPIVPSLWCCFTNCDRRVVWRGKEGGNRVALTIDDVPRRDSALKDLAELLIMLEKHNRTKATFFLIWSEMQHFRDDRVRLVEMLRDNGHEIGIHFDGRWGCTVSDTEICRQTVEALHALQRHCGVVPRYARMPGGFSRRSTVTKLEGLGLTVVNGTAYPFDVDLCQRLSPAALGRCAANLAWRGGRIAILHDRDNLLPKIEAFLEQARRNDCRVVRLDALLDDIGPARTRTRTRTRFMPIPVLNF
tara:strand:+ start:1343 stop:2113 length:771 start_codon:yes stop_codon:yes gene_type:complete